MNFVDDKFTAMFFFWHTEDPQIETELKNKKLFKIKVNSQALTNAQILIIVQMFHFNEKNSSAKNIPKKRHFISSQIAKKLTLVKLYHCIRNKIYLSKKVTYLI